MKYECLYRITLYHWGYLYCSRTDVFVVYAKNLEQAEKKANKQLSKLCDGNYELLSVSLIKEVE